MPDKEYLILLDVDARKRHTHRTEKGKIVEFVVQLEVRSGPSWKTVIRYDCAHDFAHKDCYNNRDICRKINIQLNYEDALIFADEDINENWQIYREKFLKGEFP
jgi:hypothetical protein